MTWNLFKFASRGFLGVDIGTFSVKIVELSRSGERIKLENYGEMQAGALYEKSFRTFEKRTLTVANYDVVRVISAILEEAKIKTQKAYFTIPDFSSFFTTFSLPSMTEDELQQAVRYEARQHIPLPLSEVTLDWQLIGRKGSSQKASHLKILLVAVPNETIHQYQDIAARTGLKLLSLEAEVFSLTRALINNQKEDKATTALIDIGARSTTISIIDGGVLKTSHSFDTSGNDLTNIISKGLHLDYLEAEALKKQYGITYRSAIEPKGKEVGEIQMPLIDLIIDEAKKIIQNFFQAENREIQKIILAGGSARLPGLVEYFSESLESPVELAEPFSAIYCPPILENTLKLMSPGYAIATGAALRGFEQFTGKL